MQPFFGTQTRRELPQNEGLFSMASNDYLGISKLSLQEEFIKKYAHLALGSASSRLLCAKNEEFVSFEESLRLAYGMDALLFNSAYVANLGVISALALIKDVLFVCDKHVHASIIDALILGKAKFKRYPHARLDLASKILANRKQKYAVVVSEGLFSMDGDSTKMDEFCALKSNNVYLYLDEAHSYGVLGSSGLGLCKDYAKMLDFVVLGFGKAGFSQGASLLCKKEFKQFFINKARGFVYSTALSPFITAWNHFVFKHIPSLNAQRKHLQRLNSLAKKLNPSLKGESCILTLFFADKKGANKASLNARKNGFYVPVINPPTVQKTCLRLTLNASMSEENIKDLLSVI